jgi:hypothetical protein
MSDNLSQRSVTTLVARNLTHTIRRALDYIHYVHMNSVGTGPFGCGDVLA